MGKKKFKNIDINEDTNKPKTIINGNSLKYSFLSKE